MSKKSKFFIAALISFLTCTLWCGIVNAESYYLDDLENSAKQLYCINHAGHLNHKAYAKTKINYNSVLKVNIKGDVATIYRNGKMYTSKSYRNAKLAYILAGGSSEYGLGYGKKEGNNWTPRQLALWKNWNDWYGMAQSENQLDIGDLKLSDSTNDDAENEASDILNYKSEKLLKEAQEYATGKGASQSSIELISKSNKRITTDEGIFYGPFRVKYSGQIQSIGIYDSNSNTITSKIQICTTTKASSAIDKHTNFANAKLPNNKDFYIYVNSADAENFTINGIKINVQSTQFKEVDFSVLVTTDYANNGIAQRLIRVLSTKNTTGGESSITIGFATHTDLTIKKADAYDSHALDGAKFILRHDNKCAIARKDADGKYNVTGWTPYEEDATRIEIGINGTTIGIDRDEKTLYALQEVEAPKGYECKLAYSGKSTGIYDNSVYGDKYGLDGSKYFFDLDASNAGRTVEIQFINPKKITLTIEKVNKNNKTQKLANVQFYFKHNNKYAIVNGENSQYDVIDWTSDIEKASKIITDSQGQIKISFAEDPQKASENRFIYGLEEIQDNNKINMGQEPKFIEGNGTYKQYEGGYKVAFYVNGEYNASTKKIDYKNLKDVSIVVGNELPEERIITLRKVSSTNKNQTVNATFVIAHDNSYANASYENGVWVVKKWLPYSLGQYNLNSNEVTKITLKNGEAKIKLPIDDKLYGFIEVGTESGYTMKLGYLAEESKNITPFDSTGKQWAIDRGINSSGILNNWEDPETKKNISEFFFNINKNISSKDEIKVCLTNNGDTKGLKKLVIKGRVWLDTPEGKENVGDKLYDTSDGRPKYSVRVKLMKKNGGLASYSSEVVSDSKNNLYPSDNITNVSTYDEFAVRCNEPIYKLVREIHYRDHGIRSYYIKKYVLCGYKDIYLDDYYLRFEYPSQQEGDKITIYRAISYNLSDPDDLEKIRNYKNNSKAIYGDERDAAEIHNLSKYVENCFSTYQERMKRYTGEAYDNINYGNKYDMYLDYLEGYEYNSWSFTEEYGTVGLLEYMNLGLKERVATGGDIVENLEYVRIVMPSQTNSNEKNTYIYEYGSLYGDDYREEINPEFPQVQQKINKYYTRPMYPSDIYSTLGGGSKMEVYVVYSITITNSIPMDDEIHMDIIDLINTYDVNRYQFSTATDDISNNRMVNAMQGDFKNWNDNGNGTLTRIKKGTTYDDIGHEEPRGYGQDKTQYVEDLDIDESVTYYVQFKVTDDGLRAILQNPDGIAEANPTKATAQIRHYYEDWHMHKIDKDESTECTIKEYSRIKNISDDAPYMIFFIDKNVYDRTIQGTVFYDKEIENADNDVIGDGEYSKENDGTVEGITVELRRANLSGGYTYNTGDGINEPFTGNETNFAKIYNENNKNGIDAITKTNSEGHYEFVGVTPGDYFLVFKYPDGNMYIKGVEQYDKDVAITTPNYLKSTIVSSNIIQEAILKQSDFNWYRNLWTENEEKTAYSVAVDNLPLRSKLNEQQWNKLYDGLEENTIKTMIAGSAPFKIKIESDNSNNRSSEQSNMNKFRECDYSMFNFGIIRQAEQKASIEKVISNVKLTHDPQVIFDGNPQELTSQNVGVTDLDNDKKNGGSTYTRVEIPQEALYGSRLTLTYELRVRNESENNYYETDESKYGYWYMFGYKTSVQPVTLSTVVDDYLDKYLTYEGNTNNAKKKELTDYSKEKAEIKRTYYTKDYISKKFGIVSSSDIDSSKMGDSINEQETLMYELTYNNKIKKEETETVSLNASKLLSGRENEWNYQNSAEIKKLKNRTNDGQTSDKTDHIEETKSIGLVITPEKLNNPNVKIEEKQYPNTEIVITTPTGMDKQSKTLYIITGIVSLIVLCGGIIIIKKKVL